MIALLLFIVLLLILIWIWMKESRIYLFLFHKLVFPARSGPALHVNKHLHFPDSDKLENNWQVIAHELKELMNRNTALPRFHEVDKANHKISFDEGPAWKAVVLKAYDGWFTKNCSDFPETYELLKDMPEVSTAMFSILEPGVNIPAHTGKFSGIYRYHLALAVPQHGECYINVNGVPYYWKQGEGILFNDTYLHYVKNDSSEYRIVLFLDIKKKAGAVVTSINQMILSLIKASPVFKKALITGKISND
jgi:ornithine lipid ester-linked acyl 2-hydroxylase